jgi:hypothetical protein
MKNEVRPWTLKHAKWAWKLFKAQRAEDNGDYKRSLQLLAEAGQIKALWAPGRVQTARLLLRDQRIEEAQSAFAALRKELETSDDPKDQYLRCYCAAMLADIRGDFGQYQHQARRAGSIACKERLRRLFPLVANGVS